VSLIFWLKMTKCRDTHWKACICS